MLELEFLNFKLLLLPKAELRPTLLFETPLLRLLLLSSACGLPQPLLLSALLLFVPLGLGFLELLLLSLLAKLQLFLSLGGLADAAGKFAEFGRGAYFCEVESVAYLRGRPSVIEGAHDAADHIAGTGGELIAGSELVSTRDPATVNATLDGGEVAVLVGAVGQPVRRD